jgi:sugar lactone lactonase YvrE
MQTTTSRTSQLRRAAWPNTALAFAAALLFSACGTTPAITTCEAADGVTPICKFHNPEDLVVDASGEWFIVSQSPLGDMPGTLVAFRPADGKQQLLWPLADTAASDATGEAGDAKCPGLPDTDAFVPHGIDLSRDLKTLFVVNHGGRETVEFFAVGASGGAPTLTWTGCAVMPEGAMMNDVATLPAAPGADSDFVVTQMANSGISGSIALLRGAISGKVFRWSKDSGIRPIPSTEGMGPNGVEVSEDGTMLFFSEWIGQNLVRVALDGSGRSSVPLGFSPDNLTWTPDGKLLVGGQIATAIEAIGCFEVLDGTCGLPSAATLVDPATLELDRIWTHDPPTVAGGASVALEHKGKIWIGTFGGDRLAWFDRPAR